VSPEELEAALSRSQPVSDAELAAFIAQERAPGREVENPDRVRPYLAFKKSHQRRSSVLQAARTRARIEIYLHAPKRPRLPIEVADGVSLDPGSGPVLVAYTNYTCAICRATHLELDRLRAEKAPPRIILHDFAQDTAAIEAATVVRCAARGGRAHRARRILLTRMPPAAGMSRFAASEIDALAQQVGMQSSALHACMRSSEIRAVIEGDTRSARRLGFDDPPAFVANGVPLSGMQTAELLRAALASPSRARPR
jgi:protein-disulfide isomerase